MRNNGRKRERERETSSDPWLGHCPDAETRKKHMQTGQTSQHAIGLSTYRHIKDIRIYRDIAHIRLDARSAPAPAPKTGQSNGHPITMDNCIWMGMG